MTYRIDHGNLDLSAFPDKTVKEAITLFHEAARNAEQTTVQVTGGSAYQRDNETGAITLDGAAMGLGMLSVRAKVAKSKGQERAKVDILVDRLVEKDSETVAYASDEDANNRLIADFLARWVHEPWCLHGAKTGCEINFNRTFPKQSELRPSKDILKDIATIEEEMERLDAEIAADLGRGA